MRGAEEPNIIGTSIPTEPEGIIVMELEPMAFGTTPAVVTDEGALPPIARPDEARHRSADSAHPRRRIRIFQAFSRIVRLAVASRLEPVEFLRDRYFDHGSEIAPRHEPLEPVELVAEFGTSGELHDLWGAIVYGESFQTGDP